MICDCNIQGLKLLPLNTLYSYLPYIYIYDIIYIYMVLDVWRSWNLCNISMFFSLIKKKHIRKPVFPKTDKLVSRHVLPKKKIRSRGGWSPLEGRRPSRNLDWWWSGFRQWHGVSLKFFFWVQVQTHPKNHSGGGVFLVVSQKRIPKNGDQSQT